AFRVCVAWLVPDLESIRYLTPCCLDAFAAGGLIAYAKHYQGAGEVRKLARRLAIVGGLGVVLANFGLTRVVDSAEARRVGHTFLVVLYGGIVAQASEGFGGLPGWILNLKPVQYLGKISYGVYVYHYFAALAIGSIAVRFGGSAVLPNQILNVAA